MLQASSELKTIGIIFLVAVVLIGIIDLNLLLHYGYKSTLSWWLLTEGRRDPIIAAIAGLIVGILFGHFWWPQFPLK